MMLEIGCPELFENIIPCDDEFVRHALLKIYIVDWKVKRYKSDKLRYYNLYKYDKSSKEY